MPDPSVNFNNALKKRHPGTGTWLLTSQEFKDWKASKSSFLWLFGMAGCGKTVLSATALEHLQQEVSHRPDGTVVAYFYFDFNECEKQASQKAIRSLLVQLASQLSGGFQALEKIYQKCDNGSRQAGEDQLRQILFDLLQLAKQTFIIFDALDECQDREELLEFLEELATLPQRQVCVLATSRSEKDITEAPRRLSTDRKLKKWPDPVKDEIAQNLRAGANGMFRWAFCQLESLKYCVQLRDLRAALSTLPQTLAGTYAYIIENIKYNGHLSKAVTVLQWLCFADRPFELLELVDVLAMYRGEDGNIAFEPDQRLIDPKDIMAICLGLVSYYNVSADSGDRSGGSVRVQLAHFSVKEYLVSDRCSLKSDFQSISSHATIGEHCLVYLRQISQRSCSADDLYKLYPLAKYSARNWVQHIRIAGDACSSLVIDLVCDTLMNDDTLLLWRQLSAIDGHSPTSPDELEPPLCYAVEIGVASIFQRLLEKQNLDFNKMGAGSPVQLAAKYGHEKIVEILVTAGAEINTRGKYGSPLELAAKHGYRNIVKILLDAGADVNTRHSARAPLALAVQHGHEDIIQILIDAGGDVNLRDPNRTLLALAVQYGRDGIVRILIDAGAEVNALAGWYGTALQAAIGCHRGNIVQMLLDAGAEVNASAGWYGTALQAAIGCRRGDIVQMILDAGADLGPLTEAERRVLREMSASRS